MNYIKKMRNLSISIFSDNKNLINKFKTLMNITGGKFLCNPENFLYTQQPEIKSKIIFVELSENSEKKVKTLEEIKKKKPNLIVIGLVEENLFDKSLDFLGKGIDYLIIQPFKFSLIPHLLSKII